jgi:hypothetical protein
MATRPPDSYLAWTSKDRKKDVAIISVREWQLSNKTETDKNRIDALITFINYKLENGESIYLVFNQNVGSNIPIQFKENVINYPDVSFELQQTNHDLTFSDLKIPYFRVPDGVTCNLKFRKCWIKDLIIESAKHPNYTRNITFDSTYIANLTLKSNSVNSLSVSGGGILDLSLPPPDAHNPFLGSVVLKPNVFFPRTTKKYPISGVQPYRNFRAHLLKLENHQAANIIHVHEQSIERENDNIIDKIISIIYGISSSYGNSTWRPLFGMLVLLLISFMFLFRSL